MAYTRKDSRFYTTSIMTRLRVSCYSVRRNKQDHRSGKERQCCRSILTVWEKYIARMIFRGQICLRLIKLNGLFRHALTGPDQVDIWDQVPLCAYRIDQIIQFTMYWLPLVRKDKRLFACSEQLWTCRHGSLQNKNHAQTGWCTYSSGSCSRMDERRARMKRILRYHSFSNLLPGRETKDKETIAEDPIFKMNHNKAA